MKRIMLIILFLVSFYSIGYCGSISVNAFISADDVTVAHLETMRSTFQGAINSADGSLIQTGTITSAKLDANSNPENRWNEAFNDFVFTGLLPPTSASLASTTTAGTAFINGARIVKDATPKTYTASKHTYVDLSSNGTYTYSEITINASAPSVASNSIRLARVSSDTTTVNAVRDDRETKITLAVSGGPYIGTFDRDMTAASGDVSYTGVGFKPKAILFIGGITNGGIGTYCGFDNAVTRGYVSDYKANAAGDISTGPTFSIQLLESGTQYQAAIVKTFDTDGFTVTWTKLGTTSSGTATIFYMAFR
jgi:hypothetical protein